MNNFDAQIFNFLHGLTESLPILNWFYIFAAVYLPYIIAVIFAILLWREKSTKKRYFIFLAALLSVIIARGILTELIRYFYHRPRPFVALQFNPLLEMSGTEWSFPSGHMTFLFAFIPAVFQLNKKWGWILTGLSFLVGLARVISGVHWPTDILVGIILGIASFFFVEYTLKLQSFGWRTNLKPQN